ncbi:MAG: hypothetical protein ACRC7P_09715 [Enterovibrio sp.]
MNKTPFLAILFLAAHAHSYDINSKKSATYPQADHVFPQGLMIYQAGTIVEHKNRLFQCKDYPSSGFCNQWSPAEPQYAPGEGEAWALAWTEITPGARHVGEANYHYDYPRSLQEYGAGTLVQNNHKVYRCKNYPNSNFCGQWADSNKQFEPGVGKNWEMAWDYVGKAGSVTLRN